MYDESDIKKAIVSAITTSVTILEASKKTNIPYSTFIRWAKKFQIYLPNQGRKGIQRIDLSKFLVEKSSGIRTAVLKKYLITYGHLKNVCLNCGISGEWMGKEIVLELDHINGVSDDNRIENLRILCPNCHSQTDTFRGRNIKNKFQLKNTDEEFIQAVNESHNANQLCIKLNIVSGGGNLESVKRRMERLKVQFKPDPIKSNTKKIIENIQNDLSFLVKKRCLEKSKRKDKICQCGSVIFNTSISCYTCMHKRHRKVNRPTYDVLMKELNSSNYCAVAIKYGVSDNAIRKWVKLYRKQLEE